jgi:CheY-like chemotaxis protein
MVMAPESKGRFAARILAGVTVLFVEDHDDTREAVARDLTEHGARVITARSAQTGLLMVEREHPDVLLVDLEMPEVDGYGFLRAVRRLPPARGGQAPAVALTAHNTPEDKRRSLLNGFRVHLAKPITGVRLAQVLAGLLALSDGH